MTITPDQAKALIDKLKEDGYPGPFYFQPWGEQNQNGDYAESILFDPAYGEALVYGLPDAVGDLAAAAPDMLATIVAQTWQYGAQCDSCNRLIWRVRQEDAENLATSMSRMYPECSYRLVRRPVGPVETVEARVRSGEGHD